MECTEIDPDAGGIVSGACVDEIVSEDDEIARSQGDDLLVAISACFFKEDALAAAWPDVDFCEDAVRVDDDGITHVDVTGVISSLPLLLMLLFIVVV